MDKAWGKGKPSESVGRAAAIDAAYALVDDEQAWLRDLGRVIAPSIDDGLGVQLFSFDVGLDGHRLSEPVLVGGTDEWRERWRSNWWDPVMCEMDRAGLDAITAFGVVSSAQQLWHAASAHAPSLDAHLEKLASEGWSGPFREARAPHEHEPLFYVDSLNLVARDATGEGVAVVANRSRVLQPADVVAARAGLASVAGHLTSAVRARARMRRAPRIEDADAIFSASGRCEHATKEAEGSLDEMRALARAADHARAGADDALEAWVCLASGRWTVIDRFDSDGRRFVIAVENTPTATRPTIPPREAHVLDLLGLGRSNKEIAFELGVSVSTVGTYVQRLARRLGCERRVDLVAASRRRG